MNNPIASLLKNKYILFTVSFLIIALFLLLSINMLRSQQTIPLIQSPVQIPSPTPLVVPTIPTLETFTISGVTVKNFYKTSKEKNSMNDVLFFENANYSMTYVGPFEQFYISIKNPNFLLTREQAEQKFLELLAISETDACKLKVEESVPQKSESAYAGGVYSLSFCQTSN